MKKAKVTNVYVDGEEVVIERVGFADVLLTFAEVRIAAEVLREHLLLVMPPEIPDPMVAVDVGDDARQAVAERVFGGAAAGLAKAMMDGTATAPAWAQPVCRACTYAGFPACRCPKP